jgi:hypothetical protein
MDMSSKTEVACDDGDAARGKPQTAGWNMNRATRFSIAKVTDRIILPSFVRNGFLGE